MATDIDTQTAVSPETTSSIELGSHLLYMLRQAAQAARLESNVAQLTAALGEAKQGYPERLQAFIDRYQAGQLDDCVGIDLGSARTAEFHDEYAVDGWDSYLPFARRRLALRQQPLAQQPQPRDAPFSDSQLSDSPLSDSPLSDSQCVGGQGDVASPRVSRSSHVFSVLDDDLPGDLLLRTPDEIAGGNANGRADGGFDDGIDTDVSDTDVSTDSCVSDESDAVEFDLELSDLQLCNDGQSRAVADEPTVTRRRVGSMGLSLIGHSVLLLALGMITYRAPSDAAALGSQVMSVESATENVEVGQELELPEPLTMELPEPTTSSSMEKVPTELSQLDRQLTTPLDAAGLSLSPPLSTAASTLNAAVAAAANAGGAGSSSATGRGGGGPPTAGGKFFGVATGGNYFCYVVDSSGSMRGGAWESAKIELLRSLSSLKETQRFYIVFFARDIHAIPEPGSHEPARYGLTATRENIDHARRWIDTVRLDRGGPPNDALELAIERQPDAIYLLTDGVTSVDVCGFLRKTNRVEDIINGTQVRVPIHSIAYYSLDGQQLLRQIAQENDGQFHYVPKRP